MNLAANEATYVKYLLDGNPNEFALLYDAYSSVLYGIILKVVHDEEQANDVLQDAFIKIWDKRLTYDSSKGSIFTWMLNISRNTAIDYTRSKHYKASGKIRNMDDSVSMINRSGNVQTNTDVIGMNEAVAELPNEQRKIIELMYFNGMSQDEISTECEIPLGTVKTRARAAIGQLRKLFTPNKQTV